MILMEKQLETSQKLVSMGGNGFIVAIGSLNNNNNTGHVRGMSIVKYSYIFL